MECHGPYASHGIVVWAARALETLRDLQSVTQQAAAFLNGPSIGSSGSSPRLDSSGSAQAAASLNRPSLGSSSSSGSAPMAVQAFSPGSMRDAQESSSTGAAAEAAADAADAAMAAAKAALTL